MDYSIRITARGEGLEYVDPAGLYRFDLGRKGSAWLVFLPGSKGAGFGPYHLDEAEQQRILPRIEEFLSRPALFGILGGRRQVSFVRAGTRA